MNIFSYFRFISPMYPFSVESLAEELVKCPQTSSESSEVFSSQSDLKSTASSLDNKIKNSESHENNERVKQKCLSGAKEFCPENYKIPPQQKPIPLKSKLKTYRIVCAALAGSISLGVSVYLFITLPVAPVTYAVLGLSLILYLACFYFWFKIDKVNAQIQKHTKEIIQENLSIEPLQKDESCTIFHVAAEENKLNIVKVLLHTQPVDVNAQDNTSLNQFPIISAVENRNLEMAKLLIAQQANLNVKNACGETPLHIAVKKADVEMCKLLLANGADPTLKNGLGNTVLHLFSEIPQQENEALTFFKDKETMRDALKLFQLFIAGGSDVNAVNYRGQTPLHFFAENTNGVEDFILCLIENGAKVDEKDFRGYTPLLNAASVSKKCFRICKILILKGADSRVSVLNEENKKESFLSIFNNNHSNYLVKEIMKLIAEMNDKKEKEEREEKKTAI